MHSNMQPYEVARIRRTSAIDTDDNNDEKTLIYVSDDGEKNSYKQKLFLTVMFLREFSKF